MRSKGARPHVSFKGMASPNVAAAHSVRSVVPATAIVLQLQKQDVTRGSDSNSKALHVSALVLDIEGLGMLCDAKANSSTRSGYVGSGRRKA